MSNYGIEKALADLQIPFVRSNVGDRYVHRALIEGGGVLGGEASGHLLCRTAPPRGRHRQRPAGAGRAAQQWADPAPGAEGPCAGTAEDRERASGQCPAKTAVQSESVQSALAVAQQAVAGRGRAFLRPSGTEPVVRVTVEADDATLMQDTLDRLSAAVREAAA